MAATSLLASEARAEAAATPSASTGGQIVYAIGDIHGRYDLLKDLLARIWADWTVRADGRRPILVFCGDYIDRGPDSAAVLDALIWLQRQGDFAVTLLKGNHEQALLLFLDDPVEGAAWLDYGGIDTLGSYGVPPPDPARGIAGLKRAHAQLLDQMPASHLRLLQRLELVITVGDYAFVHAGIRTGVPLDRQKEDDLLWIRNGFIDVDRPFEKVIVHGHSWRSDRVEMTAHRIGIDTGGYETGVLSAVRLDGEGIAIFQTAPSQPEAIRR